jgi:hypothetical protein
MGIEAQAHNEFWFREARLIMVTTGGSNYLYLQVRADATVSSGSFKSTVTRIARSLDASARIEALTPVVDNSQSGSIQRHLYLVSDGRKTRQTTPDVNKIQHAFGGNTQVEGNLNIGGHLSYNGYIIEKVGERLGTGTYTIFTNGSSSTQSGGIVEIMAIYGTPSTVGYWKYKITGNRNIYTIESNTTGYSGATPSLAWNSANLEVSNSNSSVYYIVKVQLYEIGISWSPTWGNLPGLS